MLGNCGKTFYDKIAMGEVARYASWAKTGYNPVVGNVSEDMWSAGGVNNWPALIGTQMEVISTGGGAGLDVVAGDGAQQVIIKYLDPTYTELSEIITMTGGVAAPTVALNIMRVQNFRVYRTGANGVAGGTILLRVFGAGATYSQITALYTRARNNQWTVPANKTLYVTSIAFSSTADAAGRQTIFTTRATFDDGTARVLTPGVFFMPYHEIGIQDGSFIRLLEEPTRLPATTDIKVSAIAPSGDTVCTSVLRGFVVTS